MGQRQKGHEQLRVTAPAGGVIHSITPGCDGLDSGLKKPQRQLGIPPNENIIKIIPFSKIIFHKLKIIVQ